MKKFIVIISTFAASILLLSSFGGGESVQTSNSNVDSSSNEVTIGNQVWMTKNLDVTKFRNGDVIPEAKSAGEWKAYADAGKASWCYYDNDPKNGEKYGKLYNWYAVNDPRGVAPEGWHIPSYDEWTVLAYYLGGSEKAGAKMKSKKGWPRGGNGTNSSGFSGLPGGNRDSNGAFYNIGNYGYWWSSTENNTYSAWFWYLNYYNGFLARYFTVKGGGLSVRCLRD